MLQGGAQSALVVVACAMVYRSERLVCPAVKGYARLWRACVWILRYANEYSVKSALHQASGINRPEFAYFNKLIWDDGGTCPLVIPGYAGSRVNQGGHPFVLRRKSCRLRVDVEESRGYSGRGRGKEAGAKF